MYRKQKIIFVVIIILLSLTECSVSKILINEKEKDEGVGEIIKNSYDKNVTEIGFYIKKGKLVVKEGKEKLSFLYSIKYSRKDIYLISIKALNGYEAIRIFINKDTILINDRINKELLYGNSSDFEKIAGIPLEFLKVCFGDILDFSEGIINKIKKNNDEVVIEGKIKGIEIITRINKNIYRINNLKMKNITANEEIIVEYKKYVGQNFMLPEEIKVYDSKRAIEIIMKNQKYILPWYGDIEFMPGENYKRKHI